MSVYQTMTPYVPVADFSADELAQLGGRSTVDTSKLDAETAAIQTRFDQLQNNLLCIQRSDGFLEDKIVQSFNMSDELLTLMVADWNPKGAWVTATAYKKKDVVKESGTTYMATVDHTSGVFATDLAADKWINFEYIHPNHTGDVTSIGDGATTITNDAVTTLKINNNAVTLAKMADMATASLLGRNTAATGDPEVLSKTTALSLLNLSDGAEVNPDVVGQTEAEAGVATTERIWTAERVKQAIDALAAGGVEAGTVMLFFQAAAPTGWTEVTTQNDKALRVVSGTGGGTGGSVAFETAFQSKTPTGTNTGTAISEAQLASHNHRIETNLNTLGIFSITKLTNSNGTNQNTNSKGSDNTHTHTFTGDAIDLDVSFINVKLASKDA